MPKLSAFSLAILSALAPFCSLADTPNIVAPPPETVLDDITVTATRSQQRQTSTPASVSKKKQAEIALDAPVLQKDLLNSIAGVRISQTGSVLGHMTSIRMPTNQNAYYLMLQDGVPVQSSGFFNLNALAYTNYSTASSTEVLKGAGTALYGSDAVAATINVLSQEPTGEKEASVKLETGSDGFRRVRVGGGNKLGENTAASIDYAHAKGDGWRDHSAFKRDELSLKHLREFGNGDTLKTTLSANRSESEMAGKVIGLDALKNNPTSVGDIEKAIKTGLDVTRKFDFTRLSTEWDHRISDQAEVNSIAYLRNNRNRYATTWEPTLPYGDNKTSTVGIMSKATLDKGRTKIIAGVDIEQTKGNTHIVQDAKTATSNVPAGTIYDYDVDYTAIAPYVQTQTALNDKWQLGAGLRHDTNHFDYSNNTGDGVYGTSTYYRVKDNNDPSYHHLSPKLDLSWKPSENQLLYGRYANGFRIPQVSQLYSRQTNTVNTVTGTAPPLNPETSNTFEVGYKVNNGKHELEAAIYDMSINDTIVSRTDTAGIDYEVNAGKTQHRGIELSVASKLSGQVSTKLAYSYSRHNYHNDPTYGNKEQAAAPNHIANARLTYQPKQIPKLTTMLEVAHVGPYWMNDSNTKKYDGFTVGNIKASYKPSKNLDLFAKVNNITDKAYAESAELVYGKEKYIPAAPRQVMVGVEYSF